MASIWQTVGGHYYSFAQKQINRSQGLSTSSSGALLASAALCLEGSRAPCRGHISTCPESCFKDTDGDSGTARPRPQGTWGWEGADSPHGGGERGALKTVREHLPCSEGLPPRVLPRISLTPASHLPGNCWRRAREGVGRDAVPPKLSPPGAPEHDLPWKYLLPNASS